MPGGLKIMRAEKCDLTNLNIVFGKPKLQILRHVYN